MEPIDAEKLKKMALDLIDAQSTMALATAKENTSWSAPVYYVYFKGKFYFFSDPKSRHVVEAMDSGRVSAAIYPYADTWQGIRGIQMTGCIRPAGIGITAAQAVRAYIKKFPFTREFFKPGQAVDLDGFGKQFRVKLYRLEPDLVYYLDNQIKFSFREEIEL